MAKPNRSQTAFSAYTRWHEHSPYSIGVPVEIPVSEQEGSSALQCFFQAENGEPFQCLPEEESLLTNALRGKKTLNLQIKEWATGIHTQVSFLDEFRRDFPWLPDWVWKAIQGQVKILSRACRTKPCWSCKMDSTPSVWLEDPDLKSPPSPRLTIISAREEKNKPMKSRWILDEVGMIARGPIPPELQP